MPNDKIIKEHIDVLLRTFDNYCKKPTWEKLQLIFRRIFFLGFELGKKEAYINFTMKGEK